MSTLSVGGGRLSSVTTGGLTVSCDYDARGNRLHVYAKSANGASKTTTCTYDGANRLLTETNPIGKKTTYTYSAAGNRATKLDANGHLTTYVYDANRRLKEVDFDDGTSYQYDYDELGRRTLEKDYAEERHLQYDALGRLEEVDDVTQGRTLTYGYDANGNRTSFSDGVLTYGYQYDALNRLKVALQADGGRILFGYDVDGRRSSVERPNGVTTSYSYDAAGQVATISHAKAGIVFAAFGYTYDERGNRTTKSREDGTKESYGYDTRNRLTSVTYGNGRTMNYTLDDWGNRLKQSGIGPDWTSSYNLFNQRTTAYSTGVPAINQTDTYDANGSLTNEASVQNGVTSNTTYTWDRDNRLRSVTLPSGITDAIEYDANGLRTKKVDSTGMTRYLLDGDSVVDELDDAGNVRTSYLNHPQAIDEVPSFQQGGQNYFPLTDGLGSIYAIADAAGHVVRTNSYDVYGARTSSGTGPQVAFGFTGREHDADTGLNYNRDRYLNPATGTWLQADRAGMVDGPDEYQYGRASPLRFIDPLGREVEVILWEPMGWKESSFGHITVRINDVSYAFEGLPGDPDGTIGMRQDSFLEYKFENSNRKALGVRIPMDPFREIMIAFELSGDPGEYNFAFNNCTKPIQDSLMAHGLLQESSTTPAGLIQELVSERYASDWYMYNSNAQTVGRDDSPWSKTIWANIVSFVTSRLPLGERTWAH